MRRAPTPFGAIVADGRVSAPPARRRAAASRRPDRSRRRPALVATLAVAGLAATAIASSAVVRAEGGAAVSALAGHVLVRPLDGPPSDYDDLARRLAAVPGVVSAVPRLDGEALISRGADARGVIFRGVPSEGLTGVVPKSGSLAAFGRGPGLVLGSEVAASLGASIGDELSLVTPAGETTPLGVFPAIHRAPVIAIVETDVREIDTLVVFVPLDVAQRLAGAAGRATGIDIATAPGTRLDALEPALAAAAGRPVSVEGPVSAAATEEGP